MKVDSRVIFIAVLVTIVVLLELAVEYGYISPFVLSKPSHIFRRLWVMIIGEELLRHAGKTTWLAIVSTGIGFLAGVFIAILMIGLGKTKSYAEFLLDFIRSIPLTTLIPVFIGIYGIGDDPKVAIGAISAALTSALTIYLGLKDILHDRKEYIYLYNPSLKNKIFKIYLHDSVPSLFTALRLSISMALILVIVSEMFIGTEKGIGRLVMDKTYTDDRAGQYAVILLAGIIGWVMNKLVALLQIKTTNSL